MSLTSALNIAQSALFNTSRQTSIVSRNISEASNPDYARRAASLVSTNSGAQIGDIRRATDEVLFRQNLAAQSSWNGQSFLSRGLDRLQINVNGIDNASSPATALSKLREALQTYAATPSNRTLAENAVEAARQMVLSLNSGTAAIQSFRTDIDQEISASVDDLNRLLAEFETVNTQIVSGTRTGRDVSDMLDRRDALLKQISAYLPVSTITRANNDMVLTTTGGVTLFETVPRPVSFTANNAYAAGTLGNAVYVDGVPLSPGAGGGNTTASGSLAANLQLRDEIAVQMQRQLDEIARGLVSVFAESDPSGMLSDAAGLFTWPGGPALPADGILVDGLAGRISVNPAMDSRAGGDPELLRDGGANGTAYLHNTTGAASYSGLLNSFVERLETPQLFDPATGLGSSQSLFSFSVETIGWLEGLRQQSASGMAAKEALASHTATALANTTGVNIDEEMALLLELEHSYQASARLMSVIDEMLANLMEVAR